MSERADNAAASTVGERLRAARNRQGLTLQKVAEDLHLDIGVLEAMEGDRFRALGAPVYARGHLRKYAQTLGLDVDALLADYEAAHAGPGAPSLLPTSVEHPVMVAEHGKSRFGSRGCLDCGGTPSVRSGRRLLVVARTAAACGRFRRDGRECGASRSEPEREYRDCAGAN